MPKSQLERLWLIGGGVVALLLVLISYVMFISPQNSKTSSAQSQVSSAKEVNQRLQTRISALRVQANDVAKYQAEVQAAQLALPGTSGLPDFLRTLQSLGSATVTNVSSLSVGLPTDVTAVAGASKASAASADGLRVYALPITAQVSGSEAALDNFLTQLQTVQPRAVLISQLTESSGIASSGGNPGTGTSLSLTMQAFVAPSSAAEQAQLSRAAGK